jgi:enamine deaminase RidA (YjgF/YER057c/UK114 family)
MHATLIRHTRAVSVELLRPDTLYPDVAYAYGAIAPPSRLVFTAGACPLDRQGRVVGPGDFEVQTRQTLDNLFETLTAARVSAHDVLKTTIYVVATSRDDLLKVWTLVKDRFGEADPPSTLLGVSLLGYTDQLVETEAIAATTS